MREEIGRLSTLNWGFNPIDSQTPTAIKNTLCEEGFTEIHLSEIDSAGEKNYLPIGNLIGVILYRRNEPSSDWKPNP